MQSRQAVPVVPVAVRPAYCSQQTRPVKKLCPSLLQVLRGSRAPSTFSSCGTRLPCSLVDAVRCALCCFAPFICRAAHPAWLSTPITPSHIGQSHHPILPTSNFSLPPRRHRQRHRHRNCVAAAVPAVFSSCYEFQGCQDCNVGPSSSCAETANLHVSAISHSYQHCPPVRCLSASLVFAAHLCEPNPCAPKKEHKRVGRAHSPSINTLTAYIYLLVCEPFVSLAGVERDPLDTCNCRSLGHRVSLARPDHALVASEANRSGLRDTSLGVATSLIPSLEHRFGHSSLVATRKAPTQLKEIRLQAQQLHLRAQGAGSTPISGPSPCSAHHFLPEVAIRQT